MNDKENALNNFINMIKNSWTYAKLTKEEKEKFFETMQHIETRNILKGTYKQRWEILNTIYYGFLVGVGYSPINWRD